MRDFAKTKDFKAQPTRVAKKPLNNTDKLS